MVRKSFLQRFSRRLDKFISSLFFLDQGVVMTAPRRGGLLQWADFRPLVPPSDRYWADPFVVERGSHYYVFIEEKLYRTGRGRIACLILDGEGSLLSSQVVLERPYHLSYPFIFEYRRQIYMLPEAAQNRAVELYRCARFPDQWEFVKTLMSGVYAADATLLEHGGRWWLFANVKGAGGSSLDALHLFQADSPLSETWKPHPRSPVVTDLASARPAGRIFMRDGNLIRPSQDCSRRYGYALKFNRIVRLNEADYEEVCEWTLDPPRRGRILATHTFNEAGGMTVIDAVIRRRRKW